MRYKVDRISGRYGKRVGMSRLSARVACLAPCAKGLLIDHPRLGNGAGVTVGQLGDELGVTWAC